MFFCTFIYFCILCSFSVITKIFALVVKGEISYIYSCWHVILGGLLCCWKYHKQNNWTYCSAAFCKGSHITYDWWIGCTNPQTQPEPTRKKPQRHGTYSPTSEGRWRWTSPTWDSVKAPNRRDGDTGGFLLICTTQINLQRQRQTLKSPRREESTARLKTWNTNVH